MGRGNTCRFILKRACTIESVPSADLPLCVAGRLEWKKREAARGTMGREKREERPFPLFPIVLSPPPPRAFNFSFIFAIFIGTPSGNLWGGEGPRGVKSNIGIDIGEFKIRKIAVKATFPRYVMTKEKETLRMNPFEKLRKHPWEGLRRQDHANPENILATRAGKMGFPALVPQKKFSLSSYDINPLLTKRVRSRWLNIGQVIFAFILTTTSSRSIKTQQKNLANVQPSWANQLGQF